MLINQFKSEVLTNQINSLLPIVNGNAIMTPIGS